MDRFFNVLSRRIFWLFSQPEQTICYIYHVYIYIMFGVCDDIIILRGVGEGDLVGDLYTIKWITEHFRCARMV